MGPEWLWGARPGWSSYLEIPHAPGLWCLVMIQGVGKVVQDLTRLILLYDVHDLAHTEADL